MLKYKYTVFFVAILEPNVKKFYYDNDLNNKFDIKENMFKNIYRIFWSYSRTKCSKIIKNAGIARSGNSSKNEKLLKKYNKLLYFLLKIIDAGIP